MINKYIKLFYTMITNILIFISGVIFGNLCSPIFNAIKVIYKNAYMEYTKSKK